MELSENTVKHSLGVAKFMAEYIETHKYLSADPHEYYVIGLLHDIGKLYPGDPNPEGKAKYKNHAFKGGELLKDMGFNCYKEVLHHGHPEHGYFSQKWLILNLADLCIDHTGNKISILARLKNIRERYGKYSDEYEHAKEIFKILVENNIIRENGNIR